MKWVQEVGDLVVINNPLAKYYLTLLRRKDTPPTQFREIVKKMGFVIGYEIAKDLEWSNIFVETTLGRAEGVEPGKPIYIVGVLGASIPMMHGIWEAMPWAGLGIVATRRKLRDRGIEVEVYYERLPDDMSPFVTVAVDPMLASGRTMVKVVDELRKRGSRKILVATIIASKPGLEHFSEHFPRIPIYTVDVDPVLTKEYYIVPGIGDAGDRSLSADISDFK